jgi:peptide/nickel transport system permease protein
MLAFTIRRLGQSVFVLVVMAFIVFIGVYAIGNPVELLVNPQADAAERARATAAMGLDKPLAEQFLAFLAGAVRGDLGRSFVFNVPAIQLILDRLPATLELAAGAMVIAIILGIPLGLVAGLKPHSVAGRSIMAGSILGFSLPTFWVGLVLIMVFSVQLGLAAAQRARRDRDAPGRAGELPHRRRASRTSRCRRSTSRSSSSRSSSASPARARARRCCRTT